MQEQLKTQIVFIDTEEYKNQNINVTNSVFTKFKDLCQKHEFELLITDITKNEVYSNIAEQADEVHIGLKKMHKKSSHLDFWECQVADKRLSEISRKELNKKFVESFDLFLEQTKAITMLAYEVNAETVFKKYFSKSPPFGTGKKKHEFPDAFVLAALESKLSKYNDGIYVISGDPDLAAYCNATSKLYHLNSLKQLLAIYNSHQEFTAYVVKLVKSHTDDIRTQIVKEIMDRIFYISDEEGEISDIKVTDVELNDDPYIIDISQTEAVFEINFQASFSGNAVYDNPTMGYYDSEDQSYYSFGTIEKQIESHLDEAAEIKIVFNRDHPFFGISWVSINNGDPFFINIHPPDEYK
jgi:hypothetical protein